MTYAPGQAYRLPLTFVETGPDATPTVAVYRNFSAVSPTVTVSGSGLRWGVSFTVPTDWADGDTVQVVASWERDLIPDQADDVFRVETASTIEVVGAAVSTTQTVADGGIAAAAYRGQAWTAVATLTQDATGLALAMRFYTETAALPLELTNPTVAGAQATFAATGVQTATLPPGYVAARVYRTDVSPAVLLWAGKVPVN